MAQKKVTRNELRAMHIGQTRIFTLEDASKLASAMATCHQLMKMEGLTYTVRTDYTTNSISITRKS